MHEFKHGGLKSGGGGKKVTNPKQAIAIGLSEARKSGANVPPPPAKKKAGAKKKGAVKKAAPATKKAATKKTATKKTATKKTAAKKK